MARRQDEEIVFVPEDIPTCLNTKGTTMLEFLKKMADYRMKGGKKKMNQIQIIVF